jgi:hypothetical protein
VPIVITEPAVGYGGGLVAAFFRESMGEAAARSAQSGRLSPPDIFVVGGAATENGTWAGLAGGMLSSEDGRYRWRGGVVRMNVNLKYYAPDERLPPIDYTLDGWGSVQQGMIRLGESDAWLVGRWNYIALGHNFDFSSDVAQIDDFVQRTKASGLGVSLEFDSRDNIFTPSRGWTGSFDVTLYDPVWGSDTSFQTYRAHAFNYWPIGHALDLATRIDGRAAAGEAPFYMLPFVDLRGVPVGRLQDKRTGVLETELRWNVTPRWALVGFVGGGAAWGIGTDLQDARTTVAEGVGFRYLLASRLGLYVGVDYAHSTVDNAFYIQVGSAWR